MEDANLRYPLLIQVTKLKKSMWIDFLWVQNKTKAGSHIPGFSYLIFCFFFCLIWTVNVFITVFRKTSIDMFLLTTWNTFGQSILLLKKQNKLRTLQLMQMPHDQKMKQLEEELSKVKG